MNFQPDCPMERGGLAVLAWGNFAAGGALRGVSRRLGEFTSQMDKSFQIRHFREKAVGGFDFLLVFM
mgnify:CR=1 FL=1|jgi:hypothetical protein